MCVNGPLWTRMLAICFCWLVAIDRPSVSLREMRFKKKTVCIIQGTWWQNDKKFHISVNCSCFIQFCCLWCLVNVAEDNGQKKDLNLILNSRVYVSHFSSCTFTQLCLNKCSILFWCFILCSKHGWICQKCQQKMTAELYVHGSLRVKSCEDAYMWKWKSSFSWNKDDILNLIVLLRPSSEESSIKIDFKRIWVFIMNWENYRGRF